MAAEHRVHLAPPPRVVEAARSVMGAIDFDPWSNKEINRLVNAAKFFDRDKLDLDTVLAKEWELPGEKRAFIAPAHGAQWTRRLANKALREYRKGRIDQALIWISHNESLTKLPWMWEYPVCIPFRRLRPCYFDDELETFRQINPSSWSAVVYLPPTDPQIFHARVSRFHNAFFSTGPVIFNENSGQNEWEKAYEIGLKKKYNYHD